MKYSILVRVEPDGSPMRLEGRVAWVMDRLVKAGNGGCTPITHPGPRWADYVFKLKKLGFVIETIHEGHGGPFAGHHARYVLHGDVTILEEPRIAA